MISGESLPIAVSTVLTVLSAVHVYWAADGVGRMAAVPSGPDGRPLFRPTPIASLTVAMALALAAVIVLGNAGLLSGGLSARTYRLGTWTVAIAFALRAIGEFRYVGLFKRERSTRFARMDSLVFTPLCVLLAAAAFVLAAR